MLIKKFVRKLMLLCGGKLRKLAILAPLCESNYLDEYGWFKTIETKESIDNSGKGLPWISYPAIDFLQNRIKNNMRIFEYGCGGSTVWWAERVAQVVSIEHDFGWYEKMKKQLNEYKKVELKYIALEYNGEYSKAVSECTEYFDVVVIDGRDRINCVKNSLKALKKDGIILFDNSDRNEYEEAYSLLKKMGFKELEFYGMAPCIYYKTKTSVYYRENNCLNI